MCAGPGWFFQNDLAGLAKLVNYSQADYVTMDIEAWPEQVSPANRSGPEWAGLSYGVETSPFLAEGYSYSSFGAGAVRCGGLHEQELQGATVGRRDGQCDQPADGARMGGWLRGCGEESEARHQNLHVLVKCALRSRSTGAFLAGDLASQCTNFASYVIRSPTGRQRKNWAWQRSRPIMKARMAWTR